MVAEKLVLRLSDGDFRQRKKALTEIGRKPDADGLACLIQALGDPDLEIRHHALKLLKKVTGRDLAFSRHEWTEWWQEHAHLSCRSCKTPLWNQQLYYRVKTDITSEPREVVITAEDLAKDLPSQIQKLCSELEDLPAQEVEDQVWVRLEYYLCTPCKTRFVKTTRG